MIIALHIALACALQSAWSGHPPAETESVSIRKGCFQMGADRGEPGERPVHEVCVDAFRMDRTEVTNARFRSVMGSNPHEDDSSCFIWEDGRWRQAVLPATFRSPSRPAVCVDYEQARSYCAKKGGRLPTEAEWEYAAKAGTPGRWYWGEHPESAAANAWYRSNSAAATHPVGEKLPNAWGLYDMLGNAWEWVEDWYDERYYASSPMDNPEGAESGAFRVYRGGGWFSSLSDHGLGATVRGSLNPTMDRSGLGFRCVVPQ